MPYNNFLLKNLGAVKFYIKMILFVNNFIQIISVINEMLANLYTGPKPYVP